MNQELNEIQQFNHDEFYNNIDKIKFSASSIKTLLYNPQSYFKQYVLGEKETKTSKYIDEGSLIHCMLLEPEKLSEKFINMGITVPTENTKLCLEHLISLDLDKSSLEEYREEILMYLKEINLHQSLADDKKEPFKTGDDKRIEKIVNANSIEYFNILVEGKNKTIVDAETWDKCYEKAQAIINNPDAQNLLKANNKDEVVYYEYEIECDKQDDAHLKYGLKGILDVIKVDHANKKVYVSDLKTHSGQLSDFSNSVIKYNYWLQTVMYILLIRQQLIEQNLKYQIEFSFITIDSNNNVYCFKISPKTLAEYFEKFRKIIDEVIPYHINNKDFTLPYDFATKQITL